MSNKATMFLIKRVNPDADVGIVANHIVVENHIAFRRDAAAYLAQYERVVVRPFPLPPGSPGMGDRYDLRRDVFLPREPVVDDSIETLTQEE